MESIERLETPRYLGGALAEGPAVILGAAEHRALGQCLQRFLEHEAEPEKDYWGQQLLKSYIMSAPTLKEAHNALLNAPSRFVRQLASSLSHTVWYACGSSELVSQLTQMIEASADTKDQASLLYALSSCASHDPETARKTARRFVESPDHGVRHAAVGVLATVGDREDAVKIWLGITTLDMLSNELYWWRGWLPSFLYAHAEHLTVPPMDELAGKIPIWLVATLLAARNEVDRVDEYAAAIRAAIRSRMDWRSKCSETALESNLLDVFRFMEGERAHAAQAFTSVSNLRFLLKHRPEFIEELCQLAAGTGRQSHDFRFLFSEAAWELAVVMLDHDVSTAFRVIDAMVLDSYMHLVTGDAHAEMWRYEVAKHAHIPEVADYLKNKAGQYSSDKEAFEWAIAIRQSGGDVGGLAQTLLGDSNPQKRAIGARLLGWSGTECEGDIRRISLEDTNAHVRQAARIAVEEWWAEKWSRHWYIQMFLAGTEEEAWAAQQLCRAVADRRLLLWDETVNLKMNVETAPWKRKYLMAELVNSTLGRNWEKKLEESGFGQDVSSIRWDL